MGRLESEGKKVSGRRDWIATDWPITDELTEAGRARQGTTDQSKPTCHMQEEGQSGSS